MHCFKRNLSVLIIVLIVQTLGLAQHHYHGGRGCFADEYNQHQQGEPSKEQHQFEQRLKHYIDQELSTRARTEANEPIYRIPVVVHIVHNNASGAIGGAGNRNISDEQVYSQIEVLNRDFRKLNPDTVNTPDNFKAVAVDTRIEFCLASIDPDGKTTNGIVRVYNPKDNFAITEDQQLKALSQWPPDQYMNVWVTSLARFQGQDLLGYAQFPNGIGNIAPGLSPNGGGAATDGVVMDHRFFGNQVGTAINNPYSFGRTMVHEVGHYLGLLHTFGTRAPSCADPDYCNDTPSQIQASTDYGNCEEEIIDLCAPIVMFQNYMDYSFDRCMNLFTQDQKNRMRAILELSSNRNSLLSSTKCCETKLVSDKMRYEDFESVTQFDEVWEVDGEESTWKLDFYDQPNKAFIVEKQNESADTVFLVSPVFQFDDFINPAISFEYAYQNTNSNSRIDVFYEIACTNTWRFIGSINGNDLQTTATSPWKEKYYQLSVLEGVSVVRFGFRVISASSVPIALDNIAVFYESSETPELYPNPTTEEVFLKLVYEGKQTINFELFNALGQLVFKTETLPNYSNVYKLPLVGYNPGIYILRTRVGEQTYKNKFMVY